MNGLHRTVTAVLTQANSAGLSRQRFDYVNGLVSSAMELPVIGGALGDFKVSGPGLGR